MSLDLSMTKMRLLFLQDAHIVFDSTPYKQFITEPPYSSHMRPAINIDYMLQNHLFRSVTYYEISSHKNKKW